MCGILFSNNPCVSEVSFNGALLMMHHRGPDAHRTEFLGPNKLGHTRLRILDLDSRSDQPFRSACGRYLMVFNGEIYNYKDLEKKYELNLRTSGDTEVLVELFVLLKERVLDELLGMFAFVVLDTQTNEIFAARDRLGVKPLYIMRDRDNFTLSSEIRPLLELFGTPTVDILAIRQYMKARAFFNGRTLYKGISMVPAGHYFQEGKLKKYWDLPCVDDYTKQVNDEELKVLLQSAVDYRCLADVPVGSYLSGGVDSTIVAALSGKPNTWTIGFEEANEFRWARIAADKFGASHTEVLINSEEFRELARYLIEYRKEPLSVPNEVLLYKMTKSVKTLNTVVLSGEGADELFFGYDRIFRWAANADWDLREFDRHYSYGSHRDDEVLEDILAPIKDRTNCLDKVSVFFQKYHLHGLLRRVDNSTMMCSVEARVPFVDHRLVELMYGVGMEYRYKDGIVKAPLKRIYSNILPLKVIDRPKVGFPVPTADIFKGPGTGMDKWLRFNMETLLGVCWDEIVGEFII